MATKTIAYYTQEQEQAPLHLLVSISTDHIGCAVTIAETGKAVAFEMFTLENDINDWSDVFFEVKQQSTLLDKTYQSTHIQYNFAEAVLVPVEKMNSAAAEDYLSLLYGESNRHEVKVDKPASNPEMVIAYRIKKSIHEQAIRHFHLFTAQHAFTAFLQQLSGRLSDVGNSLTLQLYPKHLIAGLILDGKIQLVHRIDFQHAADCCYHLLHLLQTYGLEQASIPTHISGFLTPHTELHRYLQQVFVKRNFDNVPEENLLPEMMQEYPAYYFTPFFMPLP